MEFAIKKASDSEIDIVHSVMQEAFMQYKGVLRPPSGALRETMDDIRKKTENGGAVLAWAGTDPVGSAQYVWAGDYMYIGRVSVVPAYRGKGIGTHMLGYLENAALQAGIYETRVEVRLSIPENVSYYRAMRYEIVEEHEYPEKTDRWYTMRKCLRRQEDISRCT
jgi:ribosomal protein S18 acetylase RimI-like enzyme